MRALLPDGPPTFARLRRGRQGRGYNTEPSLRPISVYLAFDLRGVNADNPGLHGDQTDIAQQLQDKEDAKG
jgi:hypothetical protein